MATIRTLGLAVLSLAISAATFGQLAPNSVPFQQADSTGKLKSGNLVGTNSIVLFGPSGTYLTSSTISGNYDFTGTLTAGSFSGSLTSPIPISQVTSGTNSGTNVFSGPNSFTNLVTGTITASLNSGTSGVSISSNSPVIYQIGTQAFSDNQMIPSSSIDGINFKTLNKWASFYNTAGLDCRDIVVRHNLDGSPAQSGGMYWVAYTNGNSGSGYSGTTFGIASCTSLGGPFTHVADIVPQLASGTATFVFMGDWVVDSTGTDHIIVRVSTGTSGIQGPGNIILTDTNSGTFTSGWVYGGTVGGIDPVNSNGYQVFSISGTNYIGFDNYTANSIGYVTSTTALFSGYGNYVAVATPQSGTNYEGQSYVHLTGNTWNVYFQALSGTVNDLMFSVTSTTGLGGSFTTIPVAINNDLIGINSSAAHMYSGTTLSIQTNIGQAGNPSYGPILAPSFICNASTLGGHQPILEPWPTDLSHPYLAFNGQTVGVESDGNQISVLTGTIGFNVYRGSSLTELFSVDGSTGNVTCVGSGSFSGNVVSSGTYVGNGAGLTSIPNTALVNSLITINGTPIALGSSGTIATGASITRFTGTLVSGSASISNALFSSTARMWVQDNASSITNVGALALSVTGTTALIQSSVGVLDTSPFTLFYSSQ